MSLKVMTRGRERSAEENLLKSKLADFCVDGERWARASGSPW